MHTRTWQHSVCNAGSYGALNRAGQMRLDPKGIPFVLVLSPPRAAQTSISHGGWREPGAHLGGRAHSLLAHLALIHVARRLVEVRVGRQGCHHAQHCRAVHLRMAILHARRAGRFPGPIGAPALATHPALTYKNAVDWTST